MHSNRSTDSIETVIKYRYISCYYKRQAAQVEDYDLRLNMLPTQLR
jgi:hypothetical protein